MTHHGERIWDDAAVCHQTTIKPNKERIVSQLDGQHIIAIAGLDAIQYTTFESNKVVLTCSEHLYIEHCSS